VTASRNAYKGGHWLALREWSRLVNAEVRTARDLIERCEQSRPERARSRLQLTGSFSR